VPLLFLAIRRWRSGSACFCSPSSSGQRWLIAWFGIRGVGSLYYLMFAINHGVTRELADQPIALTLAVVDFDHCPRHRSRR
jgi:NhaP-type Na+/H+ or K+/H+ antiporter